MDSLSSSIKLSNELMRSGILSGFNSIRVEKPSKQDSEKSPQELEAERRKKKRDQKKKERERAYLTNGRKIDWSGRELRELPEKLFDFENFDGLTKLILRSNQLCTFPGEISMLRGLTYLDYSDNMVKGKVAPLPPSLHGLKRILLVPRCPLCTMLIPYTSELPKEIGGLYRLRELHLDSNRLESLPGEIGKLTRLRVLNVGNVRQRPLSPLVQVADVQVHLLALYRAKDGTTCCECRPRRTSCGVSPTKSGCSPSSCPWMLATTRSPPCLFRCLRTARSSSSSICPEIRLDVSLRSLLSSPLANSC